jgi:hypothetical protein
LSSADVTRVVVIRDPEQVCGQIGAGFQAATTQKATFREAAMAAFAKSWRRALSRDPT